MLVGVAALYLAWDLGSRQYDDFVFPHPGSTWQAFRDTWSDGTWWREIRLTLQHVAIAFAVTVGLGVPLGILIGRFWAIEDLTRPLLLMLLTLPTLVLILIVQIFRGENATSVITVTVATAFTFFVFNVIQGTKQVDRELLEMGRAYGARPATLARTVYLPSVVPYVLAGCRVALGVIWQVTLFAEFLLGAGGVGFQISTDIKLLYISRVFMWGLSIVALALLIEFGIFRPLEAVLTRHQRRDR